ncbi:MAG: 2,3-bisphosphoglycerate-independent phosphoglycerate mutase [Candidatus Uhrbacteria bacterium GW2011_GWE2_40_58]|nr:MAG: 2,3-bisphosphoglycerate-independent phosphoglycerate mutase [Candidatus Uhrbacteria bacterium GW2011_GWF2_40_263]KKR68270.1 MAG: 2,3-bisphosphoglycerate-independent phosphoglycerate mutase [Candidatus Uhrbacteria bacterium GW2011_GWE2_40_58]OGL92071.1 MAG: phosphoglycerate mutase (2,3-diphosphoglycerate-independent) [Candidatus Uhrbacteria bacterium RIFOXYA2_FULL_40_9]OGL97529.1 MAG: phosphoglycerate mutase (2,3-diphosphoglycerate-independent) [Candidatus Uhrbacteria bacterium RIFOXYB2_F
MRGKKKESSVFPAVLVILDGFGVAPKEQGNAIIQAKTPVFDHLVRQYPAMTLRASGEEVGLQWGEVGNSEVGHLTIGSGRVQDQLLPKINHAIAHGEFFQLEGLRLATQQIRQQKSQLHLVGLVSDGDVHASEQHLYALLEYAAQQKLQDVFVHVILDGRDTLYNAGIDHVTALQQKMKTLGVGKIASLTGRSFAMDRDHHWTRTQKAYEAIVEGKGILAIDPLQAVKDSYSKEIFDEDVLPIVIGEEGHPIGLMKDQDVVICFNFRSDRMRQLIQAFSFPEFDLFPRRKIINLFVISMTEYGKHYPTTSLFSTEISSHCLAEVFSQQGLRQLHIAETEKYAHITYFLNGKEEEPFPLEDRLLIPSPHVSSYEKTPGMSTMKIAHAVVKDLQAKKHEVILVNLASPDMVAHTGNLEATIQAIEIVDEALGKIVNATLAKEGTVFLTADHGNAEEMVKTRTKGIDKEHSTNPVPFLIIGKRFEGQTSATGAVPEGDLSLVAPIGALADVAPTILSVLHLPQPPEMTGNSLV